MADKKVNPIENQVGRTTKAGKPVTHCHLLIRKNKTHWNLMRGTQLETINQSVLKGRLQLKNCEANHEHVAANEVKRKLPE